MWAWYQSSDPFFNGQAVRYARRFLKNSAITPRIPIIHGHTGARRSTGTAGGSAMVTIGDGEAGGVTLGGGVVGTDGVGCGWLRAEFVALGTSC